MRTEGSIEIESPIETVFHVTTQLVSEWSQVVVEDEFTAETPGGVGAKFRTVTESGNHRRVLTGEVLANDPPKAHKVYLKCDNFGLAIEYRFESLTPKMTRVTRASFLEHSGVAKWVKGLYGWASKKSSRDQLRRELRGLKAFCESYEQDQQIHP